MASIFKKDDNFVDKPNRNTFDLSFQNNLSLKFGKLIPCMCQEVLPGDSFQIKPTFGLRYLPQVFPVQTRMKAHLHFFYVRNRTIWKDWMDFIGKTKENLVLPYIRSPYHDEYDSYMSNPDKSFVESSIYDYMGIPTTIDSSVDGTALFSSKGTRRNVNIINGEIKDNPAATANDGSTPPTIKLPHVFDNPQNFLLSEVANNNSTFIQYQEYDKPINVFYNSASKFLLRMLLPDVPHNIYLHCKASKYDAVLSDEVVDLFVHVPHTTNTPIVNVKQIVTINNVNTGYIIRSVVASLVTYSNFNGADYGIAVQVLPSLNRKYPMSALAATSLPYNNRLRLNALPFRAYEAVYNSFYRNAENNPFKIDGVPEYNRYVKSLDGGPQDSTDFYLYNRNWEDDAFTTAVPTPQQGNAPRVGLTGSPNEPLALRVYDQDGNISTVNLVANDNGQITVAEGFSGETNTIVNALNDAVNFGITINDLRNVNSLQLWLEKNVRKGYKYRDQMLSHYGVAIDYDDLMIPEFIGGVSRDVTVNQISQTVETADGNLGDMAGQAYVVGDGESIRHYCPEHGYIIGIISVVPVPNYSQVIPKHFFKHDTFDYFFPEFGKIGMQPIAKKEIAAISSWLKLEEDDTFGYQRAWYDYLANVDQVHGKFNSDFYNFLLQRKFDDVPELSSAFTTVINEDLNSIFYTDTDEDKILGQIYFDIKAIRPIPLFGIPSLE